MHPSTALDPHTRSLSVSIVQGGIDNAQIFFHASSID